MIITNHNAIALLNFDTTDSNKENARLYCSYMLGEEIEILSIKKSADGRKTIIEYE